MKTIKFYWQTFAVLTLATGFLQAQSVQTWVSGLGDDANPCSRTSPCKTLAGAISKTVAGGEIDVLDPAGVGALTITKAITINGGGGQVASTLVSGTNGILINAGVNDAVIIKNMSIQGLYTPSTAGTAGQNGIRYLAGKALYIDHCNVTNFRYNGIDIEPANGGGMVSITDTFSQNNGGSGLYAAVTGNGGGYVQVTVDNSHFDGNANGISAMDYTRFAIRNSSASGNSAAGFLSQPNSGMSVVSITDSVAGNNGIGVQAGGGTASSSVRVSGLALFLNAQGFVPGTNGAIVSFGNNYNSGSGAPTASLSAQ